ncbi:zinc finger protein [Trichonephila clavipes]|nr:zinc finger protein [Trichonephila clavipes]
MTSNAKWSERSDLPDPPQTTPMSLGVSPSRIIAGDDHITEFSDLFREAIQARNVYAAWAGKLTNARPNDPKLQSYHKEVTKAGESVELLLVKLNVPLFRIPASEKELDKIVLRVKNRVSDPPTEKNDEAKKLAAVSPPPPASPRSKGRKAKRSVDADSFAPPPKQLVRKALSSPISSPPPSAPSVEGALLEGTGEKEMELAQQESLQDEIEVPVVKKPHIPPFFISPKGDWRQLVALAKLKAPSFQSQMSGRFLKVIVSDEVEYRDLSHWLETTGVVFKSFMLKQDRPVKVVVRGLPSNTEPEDIKTEIEAEGFKVVKISQMKNFRTKAPMPLFYVQIENGVDAPKIYDFTEMFGTRIEVKPFDRGNKVNQRWRSQAPRPDISKARKVSPNLDYSKVVQNKIPKEHVSPSSTSKSESRPAPSKDASINAGLLKDLLEVIEESPSIDKQTFCRAFKNSLSLSLSALRSSSADVDKTYVIFEAYCRLRSLQA